MTSVAFNTGDFLRVLDPAGWAADVLDAAAEGCPVPDTILLAAMVITGHASDEISDDAPTIKIFAVKSKHLETKGVLNDQPIPMGLPEPGIACRKNTH